jgi:hypothetical protein
MKRILITSIAMAVLTAGCGSGGSKTPAASKATTSSTSTTSKTTKTHKHKVVKKKVIKKRKVVKKPSSGGSAVTTTAVTTTAATTTSAAPPPPPTTTHTHSAPPPTTTHTTTHNNPAPVTTHQSSHHHHHNGGGGPPQGYCLSVTDRIATPTGSVPVAQITPGMSVWSTNSSGQRITEKVLRVHHTAVPASHMMVDLHLADGRTVLASLGHPLPNGEPISTVSVGQAFEGTRVVSDTRVVCGQPYTYDLLPAGPTHTYYADGVLLGSTLASPGTISIF